jgi:hypothetical protein
MNEEEKSLDHFGKFIAQRVRDSSIRHWDIVFEGKMKDEESQRLFQIFSEFGESEKEFIHQIIPMIVDTTLHHILWGLEEESLGLEESEGNIKVAVRTDQGTVDDIAEVSDGLAGELYTEDGWIARFSKERHNES